MGLGFRDRKALPSPWNTLPHLRSTLSSKAPFAQVAIYVSVSPRPRGYLGLKVPTGQERCWEEGLLAWLEGSQVGPRAAWQPWLTTLPALHPSRTVKLLLQG